MTFRKLLRNLIAVVCSLCCADLAFAADIEVRLINEAGQPLADATVYVPSSAPSMRKNRQGAIIQRARVFDPFVTIVEKGTAIAFPNEDPILHHVYSTSPAKRFELKLYKGMPLEPVVFDVPGIVVLGCDVHEWMQAYIVVVDTPFYAKTGTDGRVRISNLPAGAQDIMVWYPGMTNPAVAQRIELLADETVKLEHKLNVRVKTRPRAPPLNPNQY
jgi:plastocyanin